MDQNEISMFMDVKIDIKEKKPESLPFRNWTKCLVKIEAIKCFPCYIRINFIKDVGDAEKVLCVRINIPGVTVRNASSRTKEHSYGIFWKNNRKTCSIFFALDSVVTCDRHMRWMKKSIKNLELHRQVILESKRISRSSTEGNLKKETTTNATYQNLQPGDKARVLQNILGPLPKIPDFSEGNWSRRVSGMSGIYEEIKDGDRSSRRFSRTSIASGIYEEMKPITNFETINESLNESQQAPTPPPLPPRKRLNIFPPEMETLRRSYTNPESELAKKKNYLSIIENVFHRSKRSGSVSETKVSSPSTLLETPEKETKFATKFSIVTPRLKKNKDKIGNKRNSYSSPDLTKFNQFDVFEALDDLSSLSSEQRIFNIGECSTSNEFINLNTSPLLNSNDLQPNNIEMNISEQIQSNFNFSCNSSTINLVGSSLNSTGNNIIQQPQQQQQPIVSTKILDDLSGYCTMIPKTNQTKTINKNSLQSSDSDKENVFITQIQDLSFETSTLYENMNNPDNQLNNSISKNPNSKNYYENVSKLPELKMNNSNISTNNEEIQNNTLKELNDSATKNTDLIYITPRKSLNIDDKVPSYYPNSCDTMKIRRRINSINDKDNIKNLSSIKITRRENLYISSPQKILDQRRKGSSNGMMIEEKLKDIKSTQFGGFKANKGSSNVYVVNKKQRSESSISNDQRTNKYVSISIEQTTDQSMEDVQHGNFEDHRHLRIRGDDIADNDDDDDSGDNAIDGVKTVSKGSPRIYQKYATLARISPNKYLEKCTKKTTDFSNIKKFASLPRFKKIDFSPLKMKISNVLQRHNSDGF